MWLANLDTRAHLWPTPWLWAYLALKWGLVALGAWALGGVLLARFGLITL